MSRAPANLPSLLNRLRLVKNAANAINIIDTIVPDNSLLNPRSLQTFEII